MANNNQQEDEIMGLHNSASGKSYNQHGCCSLIVGCVGLVWQGGYLG